MVLNAHTVGTSAKIVTPRIWLHTELMQHSAARSLHEFPAFFLKITQEMTVMDSCFRVWHIGCCERKPEVIIGVVGPDDCTTLQGYKGGEGQETRLFSLTWVRGPSEKLLPRGYLRKTSGGKGDGFIHPPFLFDNFSPDVFRT